MDPILVYVLVALVAVGLGRWLYKKDTEKEERRKAAITLASVYRAAGLVNTAEFLTAYAVGDYSGMAKILKKAAALLENPGAGEKVLQDLVSRVKAANPEPTSGL